MTFDQLIDDAMRPVADAVSGTVGTGNIASVADAVSGTVGIGNIASVAAVSALLCQLLSIDKYLTLVHYDLQW